MYPNAKKLLCIIATLAAAAVLAQAVSPGTVADVRERTRPFGELCLKGQDCGGETAPTAQALSGGLTGGLSGEEVYSKYCHTCHGTGLNEAPIIGDAEAWAPRLAKGNDALLQTTRQGLNLMPANGLCMSCSDDELQAAIDHMVAAGDE